MAFHKDTQIMTDTGWKRVKDIKGFDKVLVRNFLGEAHLMQPFAIELIKFRGRIHCLGNPYWNIKLSPRQEVFGFINGEEHYKQVRKVPIAKTGKTFVFNRTATYIPEEEYKADMFTVFGKGFKKTKKMPPEDWYVLAAFILQRAMIYKTAMSKFGRGDIQISLNRKKEPEAFLILQGILNRAEIQFKENGDRTIVISKRNTLFSLIKRRLGSWKREEMSIPLDMTYKGSKKLVQSFIDTLRLLSKRDTKRFNNNIIAGYDKMISSLEIMCYVHGIEAIRGSTIKSTSLDGESKETLRFSQRGRLASVTFHTDDKNDSHNVYAIDILEGQVLARNEGYGVWVTPR